MKTGLKASKSAKCPCYQKHSSVRIFCHCHPEDRYFCSLWFGFKEQRQLFMRENCCSMEYRSCDLFRQFAKD
jgi:hypothetical protein